jgi:hypothetical protein
MKPKKINRREFLKASALALAGLVVAGVRRIPKIGPIVLMLLAYPLPYYIVYTNPRYRHAIEPLLAILIGYFVVSVWERVRGFRKVEDKVVVEV